VTEWERGAVRNGGREKLGQGESEGEGERERERERDLEPVRDIVQLWICGRDHADEGVVGGQRTQEEAARVALHAHAEVMSREREDRMPYECDREGESD